MTAAELLAAPPARKDYDALLQRLDEIANRHGQELNGMGHYLLTLVRRVLERERDQG